MTINRTNRINSTNSTNNRTNHQEYTVTEAAFEKTYFGLAPDSANNGADTLQTWEQLKGESYFADDQAANDFLFYKKDCRRALRGLVFTPASAWEVFAVRTIGLSPKEFLATGRPLHELEAILPARAALDDYGRVTLHFLLQEALNEEVDKALSTLGDEPIPEEPTEESSTSSLGGYRYNAIDGTYKWSGR